MILTAGRQHKIGKASFPPKIWRIMKLTIALIMVFSLQVHAKDSEAQKITIVKKHVRLPEVFKSIESQTGYLFFYDKGLIQKTEPIDVSIRNATLDQALRTCLEGQPLVWSLVGKTVVIRAEQPTVAQPAVSPAFEPLAMPLPPPPVEIHGRVVDAQGIPLANVSVMIAGTTVGTTTNADGRFTISTGNKNITIIFSSVGYVPKRVDVGDSTELNIVLEQDVSGLNEVVVTALGIKREKQALTYSVAEVKGDELTQSREMNVANSLSGKVAGLDATGIATGAGGSSRIIIRGNGSLNGNNMPLFVVNGMPIDNSIPGGPPTRGGGKINVDRGDGIAGINPDDIETITVLKGGAGAALYGSRASNGVILITTKSGIVRKGIGIEINSTSTFETLSLFPDFQYEYGQGVGGKRPQNQAEALASGHTSFGERMDGKLYVQFDGVERPYSPVSVKQNLKSVYRTGQDYSNTVAFTGGTENLNYRFALSNTDALNIQPRSNFHRKIGSFNINSKLGKKIELQVSGQYNYENSLNRPKIGYEDVNAGWVTQVIANTVDINDLKPGYHEDGTEIQWGPWAESTNVWFTVNKFNNNDQKNRFIGQVNLKYDLFKNFYIEGRVGRDYYSFRYEAISPWNLAFQPKGHYDLLKSNVSETNGMLTLNYNKPNLFNNIGLSVMVGGNKQENQNSSTEIQGQDFIIPYFYSYTNLGILSTTPVDQVYKTNSIFGSLDMDFKDIVFLSFTGREDWFSTLNVLSNNVFYPSVGGSFVLSKILELPTYINYLKLRGSWAQVGGATVSPYQINQTYSLVQGGHNGIPVLTLDDIAAPGLKPLLSRTYEFGFESNFLNNKIGVDFTFYNRKTKHDIVQTQVSGTSGMTSVLMNVGELENKGIEIMLTGRVITSPKFSWDISYNIAYNKNTILQLAPGIDDHNLGKPFNTIWGYKKLINEEGIPVYDSKSGYAMRSDLVDLGVGVPPWLSGLSSDFRYNNFSLNILFDGKFGNVIWSRFAQYTRRFGLAKATLAGREDGVHLKGVDATGKPFEKVWAPSELDVYYDNDKRYDELFIYDGSFIKLRSVILTYNLPIKRLKINKIESASISLVGRNLWTLFSKTDGFDPESNNLITNDQGYESFGVPATRTMGINIMLKF